MGYRLQISRNIRILLFTIVLSLSLSAKSQQIPAMQIGDTLSHSRALLVIDGKVDTLDLSGLRGKPFILDFWATWCSPCIKIFEKIPQIRSRYGEKISIIPVTSESRTIAANFLNKRLSVSGLSSIVEDIQLKSFFPHQSIPHCVWIDSAGVVKAITGGSSITFENIDSFLLSRQFSLFEKDDFTLNWNSPLIHSGQISLTPDSKFHHSIFTGRLKNVRARTVIQNNWILCTNHSILALYKVAFGATDLSLMNNDKVILREFSAADSLGIGFFTKQSLKEWRRVSNEKVYTYECVFAPGDSTLVKKVRMMQKELNSYFEEMGYRGKTEVRKITVIQLVRKSQFKGVPNLTDANNYSSAGISIKVIDKSISSFIDQLSAIIQGGFHIEDSTGVYGNITISINPRSSSIEDINTTLSDYNLKLEKKQIHSKFLIIEKLRNHISIK